MPRTLVIGDSLGVGTAPTLERLLRGRVDADTRVGRPSSEGVSRLRSALAGKKYDRVVFDLGTNDASAKDLRRSLRQAKRLSGGTPLYVATVNGPKADRKNAVIRNTRGINVVDWAARSGGKLGGDQIHATAQGYRKRARQFKRAIEGGATAAPARGASAPASSPLLGQALGRYVTATAPAPPAYLEEQRAKLRSLLLR